MNRRDLLRDGIVLLSAPTALAVAGCSGGGDDAQTTDEGGSDEDRTPTETATPTEEDTATETTTESPTEGSGEADKEDIGELEADEVDGLEVVGWSSAVLEDESIFQVEVTLHNAGEKPTGITPGEYALVTSLYDDAGETLDEGRHNVVEQRKLPAGETAWVKRNVEFDDPSRVASYGISLTCEMSSGVYCE
jgi:hypothetical protein